jgi:hypothetical protein
MAVLGVGLMFTGVGGAAGVGLMAASGALLSAAGSTAVQKATTGTVDWSQVRTDALVGAASGGVGGAAGAGVTRLASLAGAPALAGGAASGMVGGAASGMVTRGLTGGNPFDAQGMATDLLIGGVAGAAGGQLGGPRAPSHGDSSAPELVYAPRIFRRMEEDHGLHHNFPLLLDRDIVVSGSREVVTDYFNHPQPGLTNNSIRYLAPGTINDTSGNYELFTRPSLSGDTEVVMHRFFRKSKD